MKIPVLLVCCLFALLYSCANLYESIDKREARELVYLNANDLTSFSQLRQQLMHDTAQIRKLYEPLVAPANRTNWISTNSYYLYQIESLKYAVLIRKLKNKLVDEFAINDNGSVVFTLKERVQMHSGDYSETYKHQLITGDYKASADKLANHIDSVFVDSTINKDWRYVSYKSLTGH
jgi:hypothetical protein